MNKLKFIMQAFGYFCIAPILIFVVSIIYPVIFYLMMRDKPYIKEDPLDLGFFSFLLFLWTIVAGRIIWFLI